MRKVLLIVVVLLVALGGAGAGFFFFAKSLPPAATGWVPASLRPALHLEEVKQDKPPPPPETPAYYDLPDVVMEMPVTGKGNELVRLASSLRLRGLPDVPAIQDALPRIHDAFQTYLRDNEIGPLERPEGLEKFRKGMLARLQTIAAPARIDDLLIREVQLQ